LHPTQRLWRPRHASAISSFPKNPCIESIIIPGCPSTTSMVGSHESSLIFILLKLLFPSVPILFTVSIYSKALSSNPCMSLYIHPYLFLYKALSLVPSLVPISL
jgi:hypothetical protein